MKIKLESFSASDVFWIIISLGVAGCSILTPIAQCTRDLRAEPVQEIK